MIIERANELIKQRKFAEAESLCRQLLDAEEITEERLQANLIVAQCKMNQGAKDEALDIASKVFVLAETIDAVQYQTQAAKLKARTYFFKADYVSADEYVQQALDLCNALTDKNVVVEAELLNLSAAIAIKLANYDRALKYLLKADSIVQNLDFLPIHADIAGNIGITYRYMGELSSALSYQKKALHIFDMLQNLHGISSSLANIALLHKLSGDYQEAIKVYRKSYNIKQEIQDIYGLSLISNNLSLLYIEIEEWEQALKCAEEGIAYAKEIHSSDLLALLYLTIGMLLGAEKSSFYNVAKAESQLLESLALAQKIQAKLTVAQVHKQLSELYVLEKEWEKAYHHRIEYQKNIDDIVSEEHIKRAAAYTYDAIIKGKEKEKEILERHSQVLEEKNRDIAAQKKHLEQQALQIEKQHSELQAAHSALQELSQFKEMMMGIVHDLKNPLNIILNSAPFDATCSRAYSPALGAAKDMLSLVLNILDVQKLETASMQMQKEVVAVENFVVGAVENVTYLAKQKKNVITVSSQLRQWQCLTDASIMERVMINLLTNAIKYTPAGGIISISAEKQEQYLHIYVADTGEGIAEEAIDSIFKPFHQAGKAKKSGKTASTGLGLTFCKMAVEALGGYIGVTSSIGKGSTFCLGLPQPLPVEEANYDKDNHQQTILFDGENSATSFTAEEKQLLKAVSQAAIDANLQCYQYSDWIDVLDSFDYTTKALQEWRNSVESAIIEGNTRELNALLSAYQLP